MSERDEYRTPKYVVELARKALDGIDYDSFSSHKANEVVEAKAYSTIDGTFVASDRGDEYTKISDGTGFSFVVPAWVRTVWQNHPFSKGKGTACVNRFITLTVNRSGIILVNTDSSTKWFHSLLMNCGAYCYPDHRIKFLHDNLPEESNRNDQTLFYVGGFPERFCDVFETIGYCDYLERGTACIGVL